MLVKIYCAIVLIGLPAGSLIWRFYLLGQLFVPMALDYFRDSLAVIDTGCPLADRNEMLARRIRFAVTVLAVLLILALIVAFIVWIAGGGIGRLLARHAVAGVFAISIGLFALIMGLCGIHIVA